MNFHVYPFFLDGTNYRLLVVSQLRLESWTNSQWTSVPLSKLEDLLRKLVLQGQSSFSLLHSVVFRNIGMRISIQYPPWRRWLGLLPRIRLEYLDLDKPDPWVGVEPGSLKDDLPVTLGPHVIVFRTSLPSALWGIWATLNRLGVISHPLDESNFDNEIEAPSKSEDLN